MYIDQYSSVLHVNMMPTQITRNDMTTCTTCRNFWSGCLISLVFSLQIVQDGSSIIICLLSLLSYSFHTEGATAANSQHSQQMYTQKCCVALFTGKTFTLLVVGAAVPTGSSKYTHIYTAVFVVYSIHSSICCLQQRVFTTAVYRVGAR